MIMTFKSVTGGDVIFQVAIRVCIYPRARLYLHVSLTDEVTGPGIEWLHIHAEARLCLGDALIDRCRETAGQLCLKTFSHRNRVPETANPTNMKCRICLKGKLHLLL